MVADESMIMWVGTGDVHLTYIPRKPTPLGIMMKTIVDGSSGILMGAELMEGKETMEEREYAKEFGSTAATTLRLMKPFANKGRILVADSWFGSVRSAFALRRRFNTYSVMCVK